ncbi:MAG: hypothetical protein L0H84_16165 [Pseudonocardia sp.]|nr:hypothetical protein [Pseudonocardia sp.]
MNTPTYRASHLPPHQPQPFRPQQYQPQQYQPQQYQPHRHPAPHQPPTAPRRSMSVGRVLAIAAGVLLALLLLASLAGGGSASGGDGYGEVTDTGGEPSTQFYDGGSITTDGDGGIIVSGTDGTGFSTS